MLVRKKRNKSPLMARNYDWWHERSKYYYDQLKRLLRELIPAGKRVLDLNCSRGDLLAAVRPSLGIGVDVDRQILAQAKKRYPKLVFKRQDIYRLELKNKFDYIVLADAVDHLPDVFGALKKIQSLCNAKTKLVITSINPIWEPILNLAQFLHLKRPEGPHNWLGHEDLRNLMTAAGYKVEKSGFRILAPKFIPGISDWLNQKLEAEPWWQKLGVVQYFVCTKDKRPTRKKLSCSVVIPAFNEVDNIAQCVKRVPKMGSKTEIVVVDDGSEDGTAEKVKKLKRQDKRIKLIILPKNLGKAMAVKAGFDAAEGDVVMILDADMSVEPEELRCFYDLIAEGKGEFINGTRMIYPMENQAMRYLNRWGNKFFSLAFSWILNQRVSDTLCGTKAMLKKHYDKKIRLGSEPWGDFDLLFGAARQNLKIVEFPVHYKRRMAGESKMRIFRHGWQLLKMCLKGMYELKLS